jgi:hypothetical protein
LVSNLLGSPTWTGGGPGIMEAASLGALVGRRMYVQLLLLNYSLTVCSLPIALGSTWFWCAQALKPG